MMAARRGRVLARVRHCDAGASAVTSPGVAPSGHAAMQTRLPARSARIQARRRPRIVDDPAAGGERRREPRLGVLARDRHVDVHRVSQRLRLVEVLHPHRRTVSERVDGVVVGHRVVAEHGAPEADVDRVGLGGDRELDLLDGGTVGGGAVRAGDRGDGPGELDVRRLELPHVAAQTYGQGRVGDREQRTRVGQAGDLDDCRGQPHRLVHRSDTEDGRRSAV